MLLPPPTTQSSVDKVDTDTPSLNTGLSYFTQERVKSIPMAAQTQTNYGLMRVEGASVSPSLLQFLPCFLSS